MAALCPLMERRAECMMVGGRGEKGQRKRREGAGERERMKILVYSSVWSESEEQPMKGLED